MRDPKESKGIVSEEEKRKVEGGKTAERRTPVNHGNLSLSRFEIVTFVDRPTKQL
jgi:hypothetical protein